MISNLIDLFTPDYIKGFITASFILGFVFIILITTKLNRFIEEQRSRNEMYVLKVTRDFNDNQAESSK
jgi:hypothetical protein